MDRGKVSAAHPYLGPPATAPATELLFGRLGAYWRMLGVTDPAQVAALSEQALRRANELTEPAGLDPLGRTLLATGELLGDWLAQTLSLPRTPQALAAARAALLSGLAPDWPKLLFAPPGEGDTLRETLGEAMAEPTPPPVPGAMPTQPIELFSVLSEIRRLWQKTPDA